MRVLCEQTVEEARRWQKSIAGLANQTAEPDRPVTLAVHLLMGGEQQDDWDRHPERDAILVGTQDMLLSRALNRGYGMSRYRWPMHFGLLNNDVLWVIDETQLMGVGLTTTAQLQGLRDKLRRYGSAQTLWMSATLDEGDIVTVDHPVSDSGFSRLQLTENDLKQEPVRRRLEARKAIHAASVRLDADSEKSHPRALAEVVAANHLEGTLTLAVVNRVDRAQKLLQALQQIQKKSTSPPDLVLIHSRFRESDRRQWEPGVGQGD